jgi:hypothetical protein
VSQRSITRSLTWAVSMDLDSEDSGDSQDLRDSGCRAEYVKIKG